MSREVRFQFDRNGYSGPLVVDIISEGLHGANGPQGFGQAVGYPKGIIDAAGQLKLSAGVPYTMPVAVIGEDPEPPMHRLIVRRGLQIIATVPFKPVAASAATFIDVNDIAEWEEGPLATPGEQERVRQLLLAVEARLAELNAVNVVVTAEQVRDVVAEMIEGTGIDIEYDDANDKLRFTLLSGGAVPVTYSENFDVGGPYTNANGFEVLDGGLTVSGGQATGTTPTAVIRPNRIGNEDRPLSAVASATRPVEFLIYGMEPEFSAS